MKRLAAWIEHHAIKWLRKRGWYITSEVNADMITSELRHRRTLMNMDGVRRKRLREASK